MPSLVALSLPGGPDFVAALQRCWEDGDAVLPLDVRQSPEAQSTVARRMGASAIVDSTGRHSLEGGWPTEPGDALVVTTSGTTGEPKGAVLTMTAVEASARLTSDALDVTTDDHWLACLPLAHIGGLSVITRALLTGTNLTVLPSPDTTSIARALDSGANLVSLVPAVLHRVHVGRCKRILLGGGPSPEGLPANAVRTYGMTETGSGVVYDGWPLPTVQVVADADDRLHIRSPTLMRTYRNGVTGVDDSGWFATSDAGSVDSQGLVTVHGRIDDVIITGGEKVWPADVERVIRTHPSVSEVLVHGEADPDWGEVVAATIELEGEAPQLEALQDLVSESLPDYCRPRRLSTVEALPRTASGKVVRTR